MFVDGAPGGALSPNPEDGNNVINHDEPGKSDINNAFGSLSLEYTPGKVKMQSITSYNYVDRSLSGDLDFIPFDDFTQGETAETKTFNQELRFNNIASEGKINWSAGGFYQDIEKPFFQDGLNRDFDLNQLFYGIAADVINTTKTYALFGFIDYKLTDKLTASAGFRYDNDTFEQEDHLSGDTFERSNNIIQPKASISYQATENVLVYTNYGRGYRTGGFNPAVTDRFNRDYEDELTDNFELGFKSSMWNNRFILNGSAFYTDFSNQQQYIFDLDTFYPGNYNYDKSRIIGFEFDAKLRLSKFLDLLANYGFVDSEITAGGTTGGVDGTATDLNAFNGKKTPFVPQNNFNIGLESSFALTEKINFDGSINLNSTGKTYWDENNSDAFTTNAYQLLDARASISFDNLKFTIWGNNILDKQYYTEYVPGSLFGGFDDFGWRGRPATYGASVSINF
ncbi:TonB-dependent receptor [Cellulophaga baltica 4]|nr:TonB-dependent receptor [Cellulophaga baltica 4]